MVESVSWGGAVRTVQTDTSSMVPIHLRLGESTVLRFPEKPKKVVLGNSNYYSIEFIDNDVAIQPQGAVPTNLFVYGLKNVYGFLLTTTGNGGYDDLVHVKWREQEIRQATAVLRLSAIHEISRPGIICEAGGLSVTIDRIGRWEKRDFYVIDVSIQNRSRHSVSLKALKVWASRNDVRFQPEEFVSRAEALNPHQVTAGRLFVTIKERKSFSLAVRSEVGGGRCSVSGRVL